MRRYAENGGAARLRFSAIPEKPVGVVKMTPARAKVDLIRNNILNNHKKSLPQKKSGGRVLLLD